MAATQARPAFFLLASSTSDLVESHHPAMRRRQKKNESRAMQGQPLLILQLLNMTCHQPDNDTVLQGSWRGEQRFKHVNKQLEHAHNECSIFHMSIMYCTYYGFDFMRDARLIIITLRHVIHCRLHKQDW